MKRVSVLLHEMTADEAKSLPAGFQLIEYDTLYERVNTVTAWVNQIHRERRFVYLSYKTPPLPAFPDIQTRQ